MNTISKNQKDIKDNLFLKNNIIKADHLQNQLLKNVLESITHPLYVVDVNDYTIKIANSAATTMGVISKTTTCYALTHKRDRPCDGKEHVCPLKTLKTTKKPVFLEHIHFDKNGDVIYVEIHGYPIFDDQGNVVQMIEYTLDITERKLAEQALKSAHDELELRVQERTFELMIANKALKKEIAERKRTEEELIRYQQQLRSVASQLAISEEEQRRRIAIDLHDHIGQALAMSKLKLLEIQQSSSLSNQLDEVCELLDQTIQDTRTLTFELSPPILYELGLEPAIEWLLEKFEEKYNIPTSFQDDGEIKPLHKDVLIVLFRAVRELLINITKHASAHKVSVSIKKKEEKIIIQISDDGIGFDISQVDSGANKLNGFGLFSIRDRLEYFGGSLKTDSQPGLGTKVILVSNLNLDKN